MTNTRSKQEWACKGHQELQKVNTELKKTKNILPTSLLKGLKKIIFNNKLKDFEAKKEETPFFPFFIRPPPPVRTDK